MALSAAEAQEPGPPPRPFETLSDTLQARSTYIFRFDQGLPAARIPARAEALARAVGGNVRHTYTNVLHGFAATMPSVALIRLLELADDIVAVERDSVDYAIAKPGRCENDPTHPSCGGSGDPGGTPTPSEVVCGSLGGETLPWGVGRVDAEKVWNAGAGDDVLAGDAVDAACGIGVEVYIIDTGIDMAHADLAPIGASVNCTKRGCKGGGGDDNGHGTHVAGSVAARANGGGIVGVAPGAGLHAVKVLRSSGIGFRSDIIAGIDWVAGQVGTKPVVANMSLGGSGSKRSGETCDAGANTSSWSDSYHAAICDAAKLGVIFVVAAGNEGADADGAVPAAYDDAVITVSAVRNMSGTNEEWPYWSNWGDDNAGWTSANSAPVAIAAPGASILSTALGGGTTTMSGTSMASPHVAGAVALYLQRNVLSKGYATFVNVRAALLGTVESTAGFTKEVASDPHDEGFLDVDALVPPPPSG